jgi:hypothetical protein
MRDRVEITKKSKFAVRLDDVLWMKDHKILLIIFVFDIVSWMFDIKNYFFVQIGGLFSHSML